MAIKSDGSISLITDIVGEFGGSTPHSLKEYYRNGTAGVTSNNTNVPESPDPLNMLSFYNATNQVSFTISSNQQELNLQTYLTGQGWDGSTPVVLTINSGVYLWSNSTSTAGLIISSAFNNKLTIYNSGYIIGKGGNGGSAGAGGAGGPALSNSATGLIFTNNSGAYIAGGGGGGGSGKGGGGGGAGGGNGGNGSGEPSNATGGAGGSIGASGANGNYYEASIYRGGGGGAGGGGAGWVDKSDDNYDSSSGGGGGGRILAGSGGSGGYNGYIGPYNLLEGGAGGSANGSGGNGSSGAGGGGGGWGASGGSSYYGGGAGGAAISGTAIASMTNNGTIYGSVA